MWSASDLQVKGDVLPFCYLDEELGAFTLPIAEEILARRAIVVTCGAAGLLREAYLPAGQSATGAELPITFTHVLIDEAGQVQSNQSFKDLMSIIRHHVQDRDSIPCLLVGLRAEYPCALA